MKVLFLTGLVAALISVSLTVPQRFKQRRGRQQIPDLGYLAPLDEDYGAPSEEASVGYGAPEEPEQATSDVDSSYLAPEASDVDESYLAPAESADEPVEAPLEAYAPEELGGYEDLDGAGSELADDAAADPLKMLMNAVPGVPGEDYPIYSETPETAFACDSAVDGGYYADEEAECQVFHICTADGAGGLAKYSFLCPNGTIFNQNYFICDWWFNVDCAESAAIAEAKNSELAAAREEASVAAADDAGVASEVNAAYAAPADDAGAASEVDAAYAAPVADESVDGGYLAPSEEYTDVAPSEEYPDYEQDVPAAYGDAQPSYQQRRN